LRDKTFDREKENSGDFSVPYIQGPREGWAEGALAPPPPTFWCHQKKIIKKFEKSLVND